MRRFMILLLAAISAACAPASPPLDLSATQTAAAFDVAQAATAIAQASAEQTAAAPSPTPLGLRIARTTKPTPFGAITWDQAHDYAAQNKTVCGPVVGEQAPKDTPGNPTLIEVGARSPDPDRFTVIIYGNNRVAFPQPVETYYIGKSVCATGAITLDQGAAEMEVIAPMQLAVQ